MDAGLKHSVCLLCLAGGSGNSQGLRGKKMQTVHLSRNTFIFLKQYKKSTSCSIPSWAIAVEVYCYAVKACEFKLKSICEAFFSENPLEQPEAMQMVKRAVEMGIGDNFLFPDGTRFKTSTDSESLKYFFLQNSKRLDYNQLIVPLSRSTSDEKNLERLQGSYMTEMKNEVLLSIRKGVHKIIGLEMQFRKPGMEDENLKIRVSCKAFNYNTEKETVEERETVLRNTVVIQFRKPLKVNLEHIALIEVKVQDIKPCWCPYTLNQNQKLDQHVRADFKSDGNDEIQNELFFLTKLFYA